MALTWPPFINALRRLAGGRRRQQTQASHWSSRGACCSHLVSGAPDRASFDWKWCCRARPGSLPPVPPRHRLDTTPGSSISPSPLPTSSSTSSRQTSPDMTSSATFSALPTARRGVFRAARATRRPLRVCANIGEGPRWALVAERSSAQTALARVSTECCSQDILSCGSYGTAQAFRWGSPPPTAAPPPPCVHLACCVCPPAATDVAPELRSLEVMRKFSEQYAQRWGPPRPSSFLARSWSIVARGLSVPFAPHTSTHTGFLDAGRAHTSAWTSR